MFRRGLLRVLMFGAGIWVLMSGGCYALSFAPPFGMVDEPGEAATSPDGRYTARMLYKDGLTYGYQHVTLERTGLTIWGLGKEDVVEVASEGLQALHWQNPRTLIVEYVAPTGKRVEGDCTEFLQKRTRWRDVKLVYHVVDPSMLK